MTDEQKTEEVTPEETVGQEPDVIEETKADEADDSKEGDEASEDGDDESELPEWVKKKISRLNGENAGWRTQLRDAQAALEKAVNPEQFEQVKSELATKVAQLERELLVSKVARANKLPDELAARLTGATEEELIADAKVLKKFVTSSRQTEELSGGLDPNEDPDDSLTPRERAQKVLGNRYR